MSHPGVRGRDFALASGFADQQVASGTGELVGWCVRDGVAAFGGTTITTVASPAAGANWLQVLSATAPRTILAVRFQFVTDANVANRIPKLTIKDASGNTIADPANGLSQAASLTRQYNYGAGLPAVADTAGGSISTPFPAGLVVPAGGSIGTLTNSIQVGDQYSAIVIETAAVGGSCCTLHDGNSANAPEIANLTTGVNGSSVQLPSTRGIRFESGLFIRTLAGTPTVALYIAPELRISDELAGYVPAVYSH